MSQMNLSTEKKLMDLENRLVVATGEGEGVGCIKSLMDANYCFWNGLTMRSCCVALRTMSTYLQWSNGICNWVHMLYSGGKIVLGEITIKKKDSMRKKRLYDLYV